MISETHQCIFVHIPKTAGQSVEQFFLDQLGLTWRQRGVLTLRRNRDPRKGPERLAHLTAAEYVTCGHVSAEQFGRCYRFAFVRNPWARMVSEYRYRQSMKPLTFWDFILNDRPDPSSLSDDKRHILPQYDFLYDKDGRLLVDFVGRFETLQEDFNTVCRALNFQESTLPRVNTSNRPSSLIGRIKRVIRLRQQDEKKKHYTEYYDDELREVVAERYAKSIEAFGYTFDG